MPKPETILVKILKDLEGLVPGYLARRHAEVAEFRRLVAVGQWEDLRALAHNLKGSGGAFGFHRLSEIGLELEKAAQTADAGAATSVVATMADYLDRVEVVVG